MCAVRFHVKPETVEKVETAGCWTLVIVAPLLGMAVVHRLTRLPTSSEWLALPFTVAVMLGLSAWLRRWWAWALTAGVLGLCWAAARADMRMAEVLPLSLEGRTSPVEGTVSSLPQRLSGAGGTTGWRFEFAVAPLTDVPPRVLLSCYGMPSPPRVGERWALRVKWRRPYGLLNPHGNDSALWMLAQDLPAAGSCSARGQQRLTPGSRWGVDAWRQAFREAIERDVADTRAAGVLAALSLGDQGAVRPTDWALYRDTGVAHLLSVSGLHVTMFAWLVGAVVNACWRLRPALCLRWPAPYAALWIGTIAAAAYALFSGWGVPSQRTVGLLVILAVLRQSGALWPWTMSLAVAALVVTVWDPWALTQPGFWLSFGAVALLMASGEPATNGWRQALITAVRSQWVITVGLAPLTLLLFQQLSVVGLVANAVAIPLVSYAITPLAMLGVLWSPLWTVGAWLVTALNLGLELLRGWSGAVWHLPWAPLWAQGLGLVGGLLAAMPWAWTLRLAGLAMCVPMLWPVTSRPPPGAVELLLPDVGQGGAAVLRTHRHTLVFDAGPAWGPGSDAGERVLLPLLRGLGERSIDVLMVSHADQDHAGGTASVLRGLPVTERLGAVPLGQPCRRGQQWMWDGVRLSVLWPLAEHGAELRRNGSSCVLRVEAGGRRLLLTGDIEAAQELRLLELDGAQGLRAEVLIVPHHGSRTSSSPAFVAAMRPSVAALQAGYLNRFGHPRAEVVERYQRIGTTVVDSVRCGAWRWRSDESLRSPWLGCERSARRRYWLMRDPVMQTETGEGDEDVQARPDPF